MQKSRSYFSKLFDLFKSAYSNSAFFDKKNTSGNYSSLTESLTKILQEIKKMREAILYKSFFFFYFILINKNSIAMRVLQVV